MKQHRVLIIGLGKIALGFDLGNNENETFSHTKAFMKHPAFELLGGVDQSEDRRNEFTNFSHAKTFSSIDEAYEAYPYADVISICTPTQLRLSIFLDILKFDPKLVIIEKPLASSATEAEEILAVAQKHGIKLYVNYMRRVEPCFTEIKTKLTHEKISKIIVHYTNGLFTNASHFINLMLYYFGRPDAISVISREKTANDYAADFVLKYNHFNAFFIAHHKTGHSLGELDIICDDERYDIYDWGFQAKFFKATEDPLFPELKTLTQTDDMIAPRMDIYMEHVTDHVEKMLAQNYTLDDVNDAIATTEICEYVKNAALSV